MRSTYKFRADSVSFARVGNKIIIASPNMPIYVLEQNEAGELVVHQLEPVVEFNKQKQKEKENQK
jgi:hypothetical protein